MPIPFKYTPPQLPNLRGLLLFLLPLPVLLAALWGLGKNNFPIFLSSTVSYALYVYGALLVRRGLRNQTEYERRKVARAPRYPLKTVGSVAVALATGVTALFGARYQLPVAIGFGLGALLGCHFLYGFDPRTAKRALDNYGVDTTDQVLTALENAERLLRDIDQASRQIRNRELNERMGRISDQGRQILKMLEEDPRDLRRARKFLNVYLEGAQQVTAGYARTHKQNRSQDLESNFRQVLMTIEDVFTEQRQKLLQQDVTDLDVQIEVLAAQLKHEGVV
jgi:5-bromo-4-chloroindolyl phosphate hydrolysis protein